jgi:hypothetical protein
MHFVSVCEMQSFFELHQVPRIEDITGFWIC